MDNLAHTLVGLVVAKAGPERASPYATTVCIIAANAPDADILATIKGRWFYLENHRGITHSIVGVVALAVIIPLVFYTAEKLIARWRNTQPRIRLRGLMLASLVASATHPILDWTNNYGVRPFLPWSGKWYYGDLAFIVDPWLWLVVGGAAFLATATTRWRNVLWSALALILTFVIVFVRADVPTPARALWLAGTIFFFVAHRLRFAARFGRLVPALALAFVPAYWCMLAIAHSLALRDAQAITSDLAARNNETTRRVVVMPSLANPARWRVVGETDRADYVLQLSLTGDARLVDHATQAAMGLKRFEKLQGADAQRIEQLAREDERARIFLDFARFPLARIVDLRNDATTKNSVASPTLIPRAQLFDLRFSEPGDDARRGTFAVEIPLAPQH
ncbi:MAG: inner membrane protein [Acidobacteriota bacterium]|nr:inner membrane protein [Acidobacteriota bacterium]